MVLITNVKLYSIMKKATTLLSLLSLLLCYSPAWAGFAVKPAHRAQATAAGSLRPEAALPLLAGQPASQTAPKFSLAEKLSLRLLQGKLGKRIVANTEGTRETTAAEGRKLGRAAAVFGIGGLLTILVFVIGGQASVIAGVLAIVLGTIGFILGLTALKMEGKSVGALLGLVLGIPPAVFILLLILAGTFG